MPGQEHAVMSFRRLTDEPFPPYTYVPGRAPHPVTDARGPMFGRAAVHPTTATTSLAPDNRDLARGTDLFNAGFYWEAHEAWEAAWHAVGRAGGTADFLKGLIKLAAAGVKAYEGRTAGVRRHAGRALELFAAVEAAADVPAWVQAVLPDVERLAESIDQRARDLPAPIDAPPVAGLLGRIEWRCPGGELSPDNG